MWLIVSLIGAWTVINIMLTLGLAYWLLEQSDKHKATDNNLQRLKVRIRLLELDNFDVQNSVKELEKRVKGENK